MPDIAVRPSRQMLHGRNPVSLPVIASPVSQDEVVAQVRRVPRPGDEVVYLDAALAEAVTAIETAAPLEVHQYRPDNSQGHPLTAEEELAEVTGFTQDAQVLLPDIAEPGPPHQIGDQGVELAQAERYSRLLVYQELDLLIGGGRHWRHHFSQ